MKKLAILLASVATLAAIASAPAEARTRRVIVHRVVASDVVASAVVAAAVAHEAGYGYYYGPHYYDGPVYTGWHHGWRW